MPAVDSKTVPVARSVLTTPLARRIPPTQTRDRDLSSRGPCQHRTFKQAQTTQQTQSITKLFGTQIDKSSKGRCPCKTPSPAPCFWQLAPCKPPADSPCTGPSTWTRLDGAPPPPGENLRACSCKYGYHCNKFHDRRIQWKIHEYRLKICCDYRVASWQCFGRFWFFSLCKIIFTSA